MTIWDIFTWIDDHNPLSSTNKWNRQKQQRQQEARKEANERSELIGQIIGLANKIKNERVWDRNILELSRREKWDIRFTRQSLLELQQLKNELEQQLYFIKNRPSTEDSSYNDKINAAIWTGQKPEGMSDHDFDRLQQTRD